MTRIPCPTVYPEVTTNYADGRIETRQNVPCEGSLRPCPVCHEVRFCGREGKCLNADVTGHWVKQSFFIDDQVKQPGWTQGERWNGWACPRFELAEALAVIAAINENNGSGYPPITYDEATDTFINIGDYPEEPPEKWQAEFINTPDGGKAVYAIGAWCWTWDAEDI